MATSSVLGAGVRRTEDPRLITGRGTYVDDIVLPNTVYLAILRSPYAHAKIKRIDTSKARKQPGMIAVTTGQELRKSVDYLQLGWDGSAVGSKVPRRYPLTVDKVRCVGDPVAAVVADDPYRARDAVEAIAVEYEPLPTVIDSERALGKNAPLVHDELGTNETWHVQLKAGDVDKALREADLVIRQRITNQRLVPAAIETRGVVASYDAGSKILTLWSATQIPHLLRRYLSFTLRLPENRIRVIAPEVGGGFGSKLNFYPEEAIAPHLSMVLGRPVKWTEDRRENMTSTIHGRAYVCYVEAGFKKDGTIVGVKLKVISNVGAYYMHLTPVLPHLTGLMLTGCYKVPNVRYDAHVVLTNTMAMDAYRGAARPEATYIIERLMEMAARKLKLDPAEIRLKNFIQPQEFPFRTAIGLVYDSGNYPLALKRALEIVQYHKFRTEQRKAWSEGRYIGIGLSCYTEICGWGPSAGVEAAYPKANAVIGKWEYGAVRLDASAKVTVETGSSPHGQGNETTWAQIVEDQLGVPMKDVVVVHGDTGLVPYGGATYASRSASVGGVAVYMACQKVKEKAKKIAAHLLKGPLDEVAFEVGKAYLRGSPGKVVTIQQIAQAAYVADTLPEGMEPGLEASHFFDPPNFTFPFGTVVVTVEVDGGTGEVKLLKYVSVDDCGNVINPMIVEGQIHGGAAQGIAQALYEEVVYDDNGQLLTSTLADYFVPTAYEIPSFRTERTITPSPSNPLGVKGVGEAATIGTPPAVVNAVVDALSPLGVTHVDMPLKPERIWKIIQEKQPQA